MSEEEFIQLEAQVFKRLRLNPDQLEEAKKSLLGFFDVLYRIDERLRRDSDKKSI